MEARAVKIEADVSYLKKDLLRVELAVRELRNEQQATHDATIRAGFAVTNLDFKIDRLEKLVDALDSRMDKLEDKIDRVGGKI